MTILPSSTGSAELLRGAKSLAAVIDDPRALRIGFDRPVTDEHRTALLEAVNAFITPAQGQIERDRNDLISAIDSPTVAALEAVFNGPGDPKKSYSEQIVEILAPRMCGIAYDAGNCGAWRPNIIDLADKIRTAKISQIGQERFAVINLLIPEADMNGFADAVAASSVSSTHSATTDRNLVEATCADCPPLREYTNDATRCQWCPRLGQSLPSTDRRSPRYPDAISPEPPENAQ